LNGFTEFAFSQCWWVQFQVEKEWEKKKKKEKKIEGGNK